MGRTAYGVVFMAAFLLGLGSTVSAATDGDIRTTMRVVRYEIHGELVVPVWGEITDDAPFIPTNGIIEAPHVDVRRDPPASSKPFRMSRRDVEAVRAFLADTLPRRPQAMP